LKAKGDSEGARAVMAMAVAGDQEVEGVEEGNESFYS